MTIGFFSPLPLAYMVPFMAAQSLAMGEAFGKSFQFGKRKISAMSNEDFNKFTFQDMNNELVADVASLIPTMNNQLNASIELQRNIFKHMLGLIPIFINEMAIAANQIIGNVFNPNFQFPPIPSPDNLLPLAGAETPPPTTDFNEGIVPTMPTPSQGYSQADFQAMSTEILEYKIANELKGSELSLAKHVLKARRQAVIDEGNQPPPIPTNTYAEEFTAWQAELIKIKKGFLNQKDTYNKVVDKYIAKGGTGSKSILNQTYQKWSQWRSQIIAISNSYKNEPHEGILKAILDLRQEVANGLWDRKKRH